MSTGGPDPGVGIAAGTQLSTPLGAIAIEDLRVGDAVVAGSGETRHIRAIRPRTVECWRETDALSAWPVRIAPHAFGPDTPARDLLVAPGQLVYAVCVEQVRVPVCRLVNGSTVAYVEADTVTYWTVELDADDTILAENLPLGTGEPVDAPPSAADPSDDLARPDLHDCGVVVDAVREQVKRRAEKLGWTPCLEVTISCLADGRRLDPVLADNHAFFTFYDGGAHLKIQTGMIVPSLLGGSDIRRLGIAVYGLSIVGADGETRTLSLDDPTVQACFHDGDPGQGHRWTKDDLLVPPDLYAGLRSPLMLRLTYEPSTIRGWRKLADEAASVERQLRVVA